MRHSIFGVSKVRLIKMLIIWRWALRRKFLLLFFFYELILVLWLLLRLLLYFKDWTFIFLSHGSIISIPIWLFWQGITKRNLAADGIRWLWWKRTCKRNCPCCYWLLWRCQQIFKLFFTIFHKRFLAKRLGRWQWRLQRNVWSG